MTMEMNPGAVALFAKNLERALRKRGWNEAGLAKKLGTNRGTVNSWVNAKAFPRADTLDAIQKIFELPLAWFFRDDSADQPVREAEDIKAALEHLRQATRYLEKSIEGE
jgi:transcriptional regulator with XRE-family HTH domain